MFSGGSVYEVMRTHPCTPNAPPIFPNTTQRSGVSGSAEVWFASAIATSTRKTELSRGSLLLAVVLGQLGHALGELRALADPVVHAIQLQLQAALLASLDRVEKADLFQGHTTLAHPAVRDDDVIEGRFLRPAAGEPDRDHAAKASKSLQKPGGRECPSRKRARTILWCFSKCYGCVRPCGGAPKLW